jgi:hypothetical protein
VGSLVEADHVPTYGDHVSAYGEQARISRYIDAGSVASVRQVIYYLKN